jgi:hypothetical protein
MPFPYILKVAYEKNLNWNFNHWKETLVPPIHIALYNSKKHRNTDFRWYFEVLSFGKMLTDLGSFWVVKGTVCCIKRGR